MAYTGIISPSTIARNDRKQIIEDDWNFKKDIIVDGSVNSNNYESTCGDLAENYKVDIAEVIFKGSLVKLGGCREVTKTAPNDRHFFGVVSSNPGLTLNKKEKQSESIALLGRVPVRTIGCIRKFDKLTTSHVAGVARKKTLLDALLLKPTIGIALEDSDIETEKLVEIFTKTHF